MLNNIELLGKIKIAASVRQNSLHYFLNQSLDFVEVSNVRVYTHGKLTDELPYLLVNKQSILLLTENKPLNTEVSEAHIPELPNYKESQEELCLGMLNCVQKL